MPKSKRSRPIGSSGGPAGQARRRWAGSPWSCFEFGVGRSSNPVGHHRTLTLQPCNPASSAATGTGMRSQQQTLWVLEEAIALSCCLRTGTISTVLPSATRYQAWSNKRAKGKGCGWKRQNSAAFIHRTENQKQGCESNKQALQWPSGQWGVGSKGGASGASGASGARGRRSTGISVFSVQLPQARPARCVPDSDLLHHANSLAFRFLSASPNRIRKLL